VKRGIRAFALTAALLAGVLTGCAPAATDLKSETSTQMQAVVVSVAESAAAGDMVTALQRLDELQQRLDAAVAAGDVSAERAVAIQEAIDAVRADLQPSPEPTVAPAPEPTVDDSEDDGPAEDKGKDDDEKPGKDDENKPGKKDD
jgi:hypothetical protein